MIVLRLILFVSLPSKTKQKINEPLLLNPLRVKTKLKQNKPKKNFSIPNLSQFPIFSKHFSKY